MLIEIWEDIPGYEGLYQASTLGRIKSLKCGREKIMKQRCDRYGYCKIGLIKNKKQHTYSVHVLIIRTFKPSNITTLEVNHIDGIITNNNISNLEWCTRLYNMRNRPSIKYKKEGNIQMVEVITNQRQAYKSFELSINHI